MDHWEHHDSGVFLVGCQKSFFFHGGQGRMQSTALLTCTTKRNNFSLLGKLENICFAEVRGGGGKSAWEHTFLSI